jgi:dihydroorotate dehydrogenase (fumarate)
VCFNRFYQPDLDIEDLSIRPSLDLSFSNELRIRLRWLALLSERVACDLSVSGGVHTGVDAVKALMAGADSVQLVSTLLINGPDSIADVLSEMQSWMVEHDYESIDQLRGCMNYAHCPDPEALERANYMRVLKSWRPKK